MKKALCLFALMFLVLVFSGCAKKQTGGPGSAGESDGSKGSDNGNIVLNSAEKVKNAILGGKKMECTYKMKDETSTGISETKSYIDGEKHKSTYTVNGENFVSVFDGKVSYSWSEKTKTGSKFEIDCMKGLSQDTPETNTGEEPAYESSEEMVEDMMDVSCKPASGIDFSIPSDVTFSDTCAQMKASMEALEKMKSSWPQSN